MFLKRQDPYLLVVSMTGVKLGDELLQVGCADGGRLGAVAAKVGKTPVWVFHGGADPVVPVTESRKMVEAIKAAGGSVRYNEYEGIGHNSWDKAYAEPEIFRWMLSQKLKVAKR